LRKDGHIARRRLLAAVRQARGVALAELMMSANAASFAVILLPGASPKRVAG
jgi:hypothetical protein